MSELWSSQSVVQKLGNISSMLNAHPIQALVPRRTNADNVKHDVT